MNISIIFSFLAYISILLFICYVSYRKQTSIKGFVLGNRSSNFWVTAISAHASDTSSWLFMGLPALIYAGGGEKCWAAIGLFFFMFLNWHFIAPRLRRETEKYDCLTLPSYFEAKLGETKGLIRIFSALLSLFFFAFYISSGMVGMGFIFESVFNVNYHVGITLSILFIAAYTYIGGYTTISWTDFFQGIFLLVIIVTVPLLAYFNLEGSSTIAKAAASKGISLSILPETSIHAWIQVLLIATGWGIGYFGQPHILNKFMGLRNPEEMYKSKWVGTSWYLLSLSGACAIGYVGMAYFRLGIENQELIFVTIVQDLFPPVFAGFILCAILAATISTIDSQTLVLSSVIEEDLYRKLFRKDASEEEKLHVSRISIILTCALSFFIALNKSHTVYGLVFYAWSGLGASFGPILILTLFFSKLTYRGALTGMLLGGISAACLPTNNLFYDFDIPGMIPAFSIGLLSSIVVSLMTQDNAGNNKKEIGKNEKSSGESDVA